jgi:TRAP-type C4-dicarboxylate transport system substrate-binding protein
VRKRRDKEMSRWNKLTFLLLVALLVVLPIAAGCARKPAPTPAPAPKPAVKPIDLKFSVLQSTKHHISRNVWEPMKAEIEKRTNGRVKVTIYYAQALGKAPDQYDLIVKGIADMAMFLPAYTKGRFPLTTLGELPSYPDHKTAELIMYDYFYKDLVDEYAEIKVLFPYTPPPLNLGSNKPVRKLEDLEGLKIRATGGYVSETVKALGAQPVQMPVTEIYTSVERGVVDGFTLPYTSWRGYKVEEVTKYVTVTGISLPIIFVGMNKDTWAKLSPEDQKIIMEVSEEARQWNLNTFAIEAKDAIGALKEAGVEFIYLDDAEKARWQERTKPLWDKWLKDMEAKGLPAKQVQDDFKAIMKKHGMTPP